MKRTLLSTLALALLSACSSDPPGGSDRAGAGGSGGEDPPAIPVALPGLELQVRTQLFAPAYVGDGLLPGGYTLYLLDQARACTDPGGLQLEEDEGWIRVGIGAPAIGDCPVSGGLGNHTPGDEPPPPPPPACGASVEAGRGRTLVTQARGGAVRIDRLDAEAIEGELRLQLPSSPTFTGGCSSSWIDRGHGWEFGGSECSCEGPDGAFACTSDDADDQDCCDDGVPMVERVVPFAATRCAAAGVCWTAPCAPYLVDSCRPEAPPPASCETACDAYVAACRDCVGCDEATCEGRCDARHCLHRCEHLGAADPLVALSLACVEAAPTCDGWASCVSSCGAP